MNHPIPNSRRFSSSGKETKKRKRKRYRTETGHFDQKGNKNILTIIRTDIENLAFHFHITLSQLSKHPYLILITFQQKALKFCSKNANKLSSSFNRSTKFTCNRSIPRSDQTLTKKCSQRKKPDFPNSQKTHFHATTPPRTTKHSKNNPSITHSSTNIFKETKNNSPNSKKNRFYKST